MAARAGPVWSDPTWGQLAHGSKERRGGRKAFPPAAAAPGPADSVSASPP